MEQGPIDLLGSRTKFPVKLDMLADQVTVRDLPRQDRVRAAFHDARLLRDASMGEVIELQRLLSNYRDRLFVPERVHYIFHTAFCGSTLLARYLDQPGGVSVFKEPQALAHLAWCRETREVDADRWRETIALMVRLISRTSSAGEVPVIKLHDGCNTMIDSLLGLHPDSRGVIVYSDLPTFLLSCLKNVSRRRYVRDRIRWNGIARVDALREIDLDQLVDAEAIAALWLAQHEICRRALERHGDRLRSVNGSMLRRRSPETLRSVATHFGIELSPRFAGQITRREGKVHAKSGGRYRPFERALRDRVRRRLYASEMQAATAWIESVLQGRAIPDELPAAIDG